MEVEKEIHHIMTTRNKTLVLAESITGGTMASRLVSFAGASEYFLGSIVAYSNHLKKRLLRVSEDTLLTHGAVSEQTAAEMLEGVLKISGADFAIAVTGLAGPSGGSKEKPIGTVWTAMGEKGRAPIIENFIAEGSRKEIISYTSNKLLRSFYSYLREEQ